MLTQSLIISTLANALSMQDGADSSTTAAAGAGGLSAGHSLSLFDYIALGGPVTWLLIVLSIVAVGLIIANAIMMRPSYMAPDRIVVDLETLLKENRLDDVIAYAKQPGNDRFIAATLARALTKLKRSRFGVLELRSVMEQAGQAEAERSDKMTAAIGICAAVGPMLGLFGTVLGLIGAFRTISALEGAARSAELAKFMGHALIATAAGLVVGIPCTIAYSMFRKRFERVLIDIGDTGERLVAIVEQSQAGGASTRPQVAASHRSPIAPIPSALRQPSATPSVPLASSSTSGGTPA